MTHTCAKNQANQKGSCISGMSVLQKVTPKCTHTAFIDNFRSIPTNSSIQVSVCRESYDGYVKHKRNYPICDP